MVDWLLVVVIIDQRNTFLDILGDQLIDLRYRETWYGALELMLWRREIGNSKILITGLAIVGLTEDVHPDEVRISTAQ